MKSTAQTLIICYSKTGSELSIVGYRMAVWLHVDEAGRNDAPLLVLHLAKIGEVHVAVSGVEASFIHDEIDEVLWDAGFEIVTTWHEEPLIEVAWEFLNVDFVSGGITLRCAIVLGKSFVAELDRLSEIVGYLAEASKSDEGGAGFDE